MYTHLTRHVKEKLESLNLKKFVSAYGFSRVNTRTLKSNVGACHQLRNHVSCAENASIKTDNDDRFGKSKKDSWTHSIHLEHSPIGLLGWSTALAIGWCMTQPFYRKCVLPSDRSSWDRAHSFTKTVFAQPGGITKFDKYLKYTVTNTVFTQTDIEENDKENSICKSEVYGLSKLDKYLKYNASNTIFMQSNIEKTKKEDSISKSEDSCLSHSGLTKSAGYLKYNFDEGVFTEIELDVKNKKKYVGLSEGSSLHNSRRIKMDRYLKQNLNNTVFTQTDIQANNKDNSVHQSEENSIHKTEDLTLKKPDYNSRRRSEYSSGSQSEYSSESESEHSSGSQSGYVSGSESEYSLESLSKVKPAPQAKVGTGCQEKGSPGRQEKGSPGRQEKGSPGHQEKGSLIHQEKGSPGLQVKDIRGCQTKPHGDDCGTEPINLKLLDAAENLAKIQNGLFADFDNHLGVKDIKSGKSKTAVSRFVRSVELGNRKAMFNLGLCYELGLSVEKDFARAAAYYRMAAQRGHLTAMYNLGVFHMYGWGVTKDPTHALELFKYAGSRGQKEAKYAYTTLTSHLEKKKDVRSSCGKTGSDSNKFLESSTSSSETLSSEDHNSSQN